MKKSDYVPGLRVSLVKDANAPAVVGQIADRPEIAARIARGFIPAGEEREHFIALYLDARSKVKGVNVVSIGTLSASLVHPREVFRPAIVAGAAAVIVAHNHPSGDISPSPEDKEAVRRLAKAGELLGIPRLDSIIVAEGVEKVTSWRDLGLLPIL